ncbi:uncharacterized protein ACNS7B_004565 [Menidia menidia]
MDAAERGRVAPRGRRATARLALLVTLQNLLTVACLLATYYIYKDFQPLLSEDTAHIQFDAITGLRENVTLKFNHIMSAHNLILNEKKDQISIKCTGPYLWHMEVCYENPEEENTGVLQLQVKGSKAPASSVQLHATRLVCRGLTSTAYLRAGEEASLQLFSQNRFMIMNITTGLSYMLGKRCDY